MSRHPRHFSLALGLAIALAATGCNPDDDDGGDGGLGGGDPGGGGTTSALSYEGLPGLHDAMFRPTCANAGCHDGTFEPDFRTLGSTYATLVGHPVIKNDDAATFAVRVAPGDLAASQLYARLTYDIDGNSGVRPLAVDPESRYPTQRDTLLQFVRRWIEEGAKRSE